MTRRTRTAVVALLVVLAAACSNAGDGTPSRKAVQGGPGVTADEIRFSAIGVRSNNPSGTCVLDCYVDGIEAYFAYRNAGGGIDGRKLVLHRVVDDELTKDEQHALELVAANDTFAVFGATFLGTGYPRIAEAGMPLYAWNVNGPQLVGAPSIFGDANGVVCADCTSRYHTYLMNLTKTHRAAVLAYATGDTGKQCAAAMAGSIELYGDRFDHRVVYRTDSLPFGLPNGVGPEVTAMKRAGVDIVFTCLDLNAMKTIAQELQRQGMADVRMVHPNTYDRAFVQASGDLFEGDLVLVQFRPFEADAGRSALDEYHRWMKRTKAAETELSMVGWLNATLAYDGIVAAGPSFDRKKVLAATNAMTEFSAGGLVSPIDWTRQHEPPTQADPTSHGAARECFTFVQISHGAFHLVGDPKRPFLCWSNASRAWAEPTPTDIR